MEKCLALLPPTPVLIQSLECIVFDTWVVHYAPRVGLDSVLCSSPSNLDAVSCFLVASYAIRNAPATSF